MAIRDLAEDWDETRSAGYKRIHFIWIGFYALFSGGRKIIKHLWKSGRRKLTRNWMTWDTDEEKTGLQDIHRNHPLVSEPVKWKEYFQNILKKSNAKPGSTPDWSGKICGFIGWILDETNDFKSERTVVVIPDESFCFRFCTPCRKNYRISTWQWLSFACHPVFSLFESPYFSATELHDRQRTKQYFLFPQGCI